MSMSLSQMQMLFAQNIAILIAKAPSLGYDGVTLGEGWRPPEMAAIYAKEGKGVVNSVHTLRLAQDLNLFMNGQLLTTVTAYEPLGTFWKGLHPLNRWGGDFTTHGPDSDHFSMTYGGVA